MLEIMLCSLFTVVPDFLFRRFVQNKRIGKEITVFSVWYELRWGITACFMLTVVLITLIFYHHPSTTIAKPFFRAVPIISEVNGRVAEVMVPPSGEVEAGAPLFRLDSAKQAAAVDLARKRIAEVDAAMVLAQAEMAAADGQIQQAKGNYEQAADELRTKEELRQRNATVVATRDIERLQKQVEAAEGTLKAAQAAKQAAETKMAIMLPAQKATAGASLAQAQTDLDKTTVYAGVAGRIEQFTLRAGDIVNPFARPAGVLVPKGAGRQYVFAGFHQIETQIIKPGMIAEITCVSKPLAIIPMVITSVQEYIASGQVQAADRLIDAQQIAAPGTILATMEPLYKGGLDGVAPGSNCIANAYSSYHDEIARKDTGFWRGLYLHILDTVGIVHALLLRIQALLLPVKTLVLSGH